MASLDHRGNSLFRKQDGDFGFNNCVFVPFRFQGPVSELFRGVQHLVLVVLPHARQQKARLNGLTELNKKEGQTAPRGSHVDLEGRYLYNAGRSLTK